MKNIYSILTLSLLFFAVSLSGQARIYTPRLQSPEDGATKQMPNVVLDWAAVTGTSPIIYYELYLDESPDFSNPVIFDHTELTALTMSELIFGHTYYWKVRAYDGNNEYSDWSETWSFTVMWYIELDGPSDGKEVYANPNISWIAMTGITSYQLQVDTTYYWDLDNSGISDDLIDVTFVGDNLWAVGANGTILFNEGNSWETSESGVSGNLNGVSFVSDDNGYAVGDEGTVIHFDGSSWSSIDVGATENLTSVSFTDANNGVVVGEKGTIVVYNSGSWTVTDGGTSEDLNDVKMLDSQSIWICGTGSIVLFFNGTEWQLFELGSKDWNAIDMLSNTEGWVAGASGKIFHFNGTSWDEEDSGITKAINDLCIRETSRYAVVTGGMILSHNDYYWEKLSSGSSNNLNAIALSGDDGVIVGASGTIVYKGDTGFDSPFLMNIEVPVDSNNWDLTNLLFGKTFYYRIRGCHSIDTSDWSEIRNIKTYATVELDKPANAVQTDIIVNLSWKEYEGVTNYVVQVDNDIEFDAPNTYNLDSLNTNVSTGIFGDTYYWRVAAQHILDISEWSEVRNFVVTNTIELTSPANSATQVETCPTMQWVAVNGATSYQVWIDTDPDFTNPSSSTSTTASLSCASPYKNGTTYYWKVRGYTGGSQSGWSETWSFTTEAAIGIDEVFNSDAVVIYPNPSNGNFNISLNSLKNEEYSVKVVDISGRLIKEFNVNCLSGSNIFPLNISNVESGAYSVVITNGNQSVLKRLMVN